MNILVFIKITVDTELLRTASDKAYGCFCGFLHNVAEGACKLQLARAVKNGYLNSEHFTAHGCSCKSVNKSHFVILVKILFTESDGA